MPNLITPDILIFLSTFVVAAMMAIKGNRLLKLDGGYRWVVTGVVFISLSALADTICDVIPWPDGSPLAIGATQDLLIILLGYAPGIMVVGYGLTLWVPKVLSLDTEVELRKRHEKELREAKLRAEEASRIKSEFLAMMSHEIRTPLNGVIGMSEVLLSTPLNDKQKHMVEVVISSGQNLLSLLNNILDISKLESGHYELDETPTDIEEVVTAVVQLLSPVAAEKGLTLTAELLPLEDLCLLTDEARVKQILTNLVGNAIKFTHAGNVLVVASTDEDRKGNPMLRLDVHDSGIGISDANKSKLFQRFVQADSSMSRHYGGTGLGLAICKELVGLLGGDIGCDSQEDVGSRFWFTLPLRRAEDDADRGSGRTSETGSAVA